ncbi:MAG: hypothetical protein HUJ27_09540 [Rhodobacteraceae bacterium]|nr:hypothetical protein [Paracoccaceae bacterium]
MPGFSDLPRSEQLAHWRACEALIRKALEDAGAAPIGDDVRATVLDFLDNNEIGLALEALEESLADGQVSRAVTTCLSEVRERIARLSGG